MIDYIHKKLPAIEERKLKRNDLFTSRRHNFYHTDFTADHKVKGSMGNRVFKSAYDIIAIPQKKNQ